MELGTYVVVRSRDQGVMCGEYNGHCGREVRLKKARQIWSWTGKRLTLVDFVQVPGTLRISRVAPGMVIMLEACGIIEVTPEIELILRNAKYDINEIEDFKSPEGEEVDNTQDD